MAGRPSIGDLCTPCSLCTSLRSSRDSQESWVTCWVAGPLLPYSLPAVGNHCQWVRSMPAVPLEKEIPIISRRMEIRRTPCPLHPTEEGTRFTALQGHRASGMADYP